MSPDRSLHAGIKKNPIWANYVYLIAAQAGRIFLTFIIISLLARYLGVEQFGQFSYALAFSELFYVLAEFGIPAIVTTEIAYSRNPVGSATYSAALLLQCGFCIIAYALIVGISLLERPFSVSVLLIWIMGLSVIFGIMAKLSQAVFRGFERMEFEALTVLLERAAILGGVLLVVFGQRHLLVVASVFPASALLASIIALGIVQLRFLRFDLDSLSKKITKHLLALALPLAGASLFSTLKDRAGFVILQHLTGDYALGIFSAAYRLVIPFSAAPMVLGGVLLPILSRLYAKSDDEFKKSYFLWLKFSLTAGICLGLAFIGVSDWAVLKMYGEKYEASKTVARVLALALVCSFGYFVTTSALLTLRRMKLLFLCHGLSGMTNVLLGLAIVPSYGYLGTSWALVASEFILLGVSVWAVLHSLKVGPSMGGAIRSCIVLLGTCGGYVAMSHCSPLLGSLGGGVIFLVSLYLTELLTVQDIREMTSMLLVQIA